MSQERQRAWILPILLAAVPPAPAAAPGRETPVEVEVAARQPTAPRAALDPAHDGPSASLPASALLQEPQVGPWRLVAEIGNGGMGIVYLAESTGPVTRRAAVKVIRQDRVDEVTLARFSLEQQALADADHEHVVRLYDTGTTPDGQPWLAMEFVEGEALTSYCERRGLDVDARLHLLTEVAEAVQHLHERGIRHGDLKPDNILVVERAGRAVPKILDFGLASLRGRAVVEEHAAAGTVAYMAPEQFVLPASRLDARSEVYALGAIVHEVLTGALPACPVHLGQDGDREVRLGKAASLSPRVRGGLARILTRALAQRPDARHGSAGELGGELRAFVSGRAKLRRLVRLGGALLAAAAAGVLAGAWAFA